MKIGKKIVESNVFKTVVAFVAALFIKLVRRTSSFEIHRYRSDSAALLGSG